MSKFYIRNIIPHFFHTYSDQVEPGLGYGMIIFRYLMVKLGTIADFKRNFLEWDSNVVPMKDTVHRIGKLRLADYKIKYSVMQTTEPPFTKELTERIFRILHITYNIFDLEKVTPSTTQINFGERKQLPRLLYKFRKLFYGCMFKCYTETVNIDHKSIPNTINSWY